MSADVGRANLLTARAFVDEIAARGVHHAVICPGSRSTPLALALATQQRLRSWVLIDERSAGFFALGMARQLREPFAVLTTSGTAAANLLPAVAEARLGRVPLLVLTADRPPELRGWGAAQTIDQTNLFGNHVKWFAEMPVPDGQSELDRQARSAALRAVQTSWLAPAGPVHLNFPFREPLLPSERRDVDDLLSPLDRVSDERVDKLVSPGYAGADATQIEAIATLIAGERRGLIICGPDETSGLAASVAALSEASGYPVLADPLSGVRFGRHRGSLVLDTYDPLLRALTDDDSHLAPEIVIRIGAIPTSKPLQQFLIRHPGQHHLLVDPGDPRDPDHLASDHIRVDPVPTFSSLSDGVRRLRGVADSQWADDWIAADRVAGDAIRRAVASFDEPFEGRAAAELAALLPDGTTFVVGNSMPVRDVDAFVRGDHRNVRVVGNRGANGIDGVMSSALGAAAVTSGPVVLLIGDLSFHHDLGGLLAAQQFGIAATIVVLNNDGGGIFSFLPQAELLDRSAFESLFATPIGLDIQSAARLYETSYARPTDWPSFRRQVCQGVSSPGVSIVELVTDRERNVIQHREVWAAVRAGVSASQPIAV